MYPTCKFICLINQLTGILHINVLIRHTPSFTSSTWSTYIPWVTDKQHPRGHQIRYTVVALANCVFFIFPEGARPSRPPPISRPGGLRDNVIDFKDGIKYGTKSVPNMLPKYDTIVNTKSGVIFGTIYGTKYMVQNILYSISYHVSAKYGTGYGTVYLVPSLWYHRWYQIRKQIWYHIWYQMCANAIPVLCYHI